MISLSIWEKESFYDPQDIIIVGAGLMGLWTAWELKKRKQSLRITIVESSITPLGASTRNAGFACFGSPTELLHDAAAIGTDAMLQVAEMRYKGIEKIKAHFREEQIGFDYCGGYECINRNYTGWDNIDENIGWLNKALQNITGNPDIFNRADAKLPGLGLQNFDGLIENISEAALHSGKLVAFLTQMVQSTGVRILYGTEITHWEKSSSKILVYTHQQINLSTTQLLFCTNAFTNILLPGLPVTPARGQIIVTSPISNLAMKGTFHFDEGFYYWRNLGQRILIGGGRNSAFTEEQTTDLSGSEKIKKALTTFLEEHLQSGYQYIIDYHWSGIMGFTNDKKPFVGEVQEGVFASIACNGIGVALIPIIAEQASELLLHHF